MLRCDHSMEATEQYFSVGYRLLAGPFSIVGKEREIAPRKSRLFSFFLRALSTIQKGTACSLVGVLVCSKTFRPRKP